MALCPTAWEIILEGLAPSTYSTPPIVSECGKKQHDELLELTRRFFEDMLLEGSMEPSVLRVDPAPELRYYVEAAGEWRELVLRPDLLVVLDTGRGPVNVAVEATTRWEGVTPREWLTAYALGAYLRDLRPSSTLLVTPAGTRALPLSTSLVEELSKLLHRPPRRRPEPWLCSNCDLRPVCPFPIA